MTRIVAGTHGGQKLSVPPKGTRPTSERVREALFSKLDHMGMCDDTQVLDIFAGSGALGIEALSRGARQVTFVEKSAPAAKIICRNLAALKLSDRARVATADAVAFLNARVGEELAGEYDLVLIDPPYDLPAQIVEEVLVGLAHWITPDTLIVLEASTRAPLPTLPGFLVMEQTKKYGETTVYFLGPPVPEDGVASVSGPSSDQELPAPVEDAK